MDDVAVLMDDAVFISYCYENFDLNKDGKISIMEANTAKVIEIKKEPKLISVKGIEVFTNLEKLSFYQCTNLRSIDLSKNTKITAIEDSMIFSGCSRLTSVTIPDSVTSIGRNAFYNCESLTAFYGKFASADNRCLVVEGKLIVFARFGLTSYTIPDSVTKIGDSVFRNCSSLTSVTIPDGVTKIEDDTFYGCSSLVSVTIGKGVISIGNQVFGDCYKLKRIFCKPETPPTIGLDVMSGCHENCKIYVPTASYNSYVYLWGEYDEYITPYDFGK